MGETRDACDSFLFDGIWSYSCLFRRETVLSRTACARETVCEILSLKSSKDDRRRSRTQRNSQATRIYIRKALHASEKSDERVCALKMSPRTPTIVLSLSFFRLSDSLGSPQ